MHKVWFGTLIVVIVSLLIRSHQILMATNAAYIPGLISLTAAELPLFAGMLILTWLHSLCKVRSLRYLLALPLTLLALLAISDTLVILTLDHRIQLADFAKFRGEWRVGLGFFNHLQYIGVLIVSLVVFFMSLPLSVIFPNLLRNWSCAFVVLSLLPRH